MSLQYLLQLLLLISFSPVFLNKSSTKAATTDHQALDVITLPSTCPQTCGEVGISYPFGIGDGCFLQGFEVTCAHNNTPFLASTNLQLVNISLEQGEVRVMSTPFSASSCSSLFSDDKPNRQLTQLQNTPFAFSESNKFVAVGCNVGAVISDTVNFTQFTGCKSNCVSWSRMDYGSCSGRGCCEVAVPGTQKSLSLYTSVVSESEESTGNSNITTCCRGFVVEEESYRFNRFDVWDDTDDIDFIARKQLTTKLDWGIEGRCKDGKKDICGENSNCVDSKTQAGVYLCKCFIRFRGNPYLNGTSQACTSDCDSMRHNPCVAAASCQYKDGKYICICELGSSGDGYKNGSGCHAQFPLLLLLKLVLLLTVLCICILSLAHWTLKQRDKSQIRAQNFLQNGGILLQQYSLTKSSTAKPVKIFSAIELERATDNYDKSRVLGFGGQGTVYKGILINGTQVAIKKSHPLVVQSQVKQFINELFLLSQINHRNIVRLLGCCLETEVPLLVYEFILGGSLYEKIHGDVRNLETNITNLSWKERLRIAIEVGEALSYLHSYASSMPIFHRDVKSSNILLTENGIAKLADFGVSRHVPVDKVRVSTILQGTIGYVDPEYFNTGMLTEKSDVYSYGVILLELLTRRKPIQHEDIKDYSSLVMQFKSHFGRNNLYKILDESLLEIRNMEELMVVARVAYACLNVTSIERPTMKAVVQELALI